MNYARILRLPCLFAAAILVTGCSSLERLFDDPDPPPMPQQALQEAPPPPAVPADWCQRVGANAQIQAASSGFDAATQARMAQQAFAQCTAMSGQG